MPKKMPKKDKPLSKAQKVVRDTYCNGEFADRVTNSRESWTVGDTLFTFLMYELAPSEDCDSLETAFNRISTAIEQLTQVRNALDKQIIKEA